MSKNKFSGNISGKGYYIALTLCAVAIGVSGYLYYRNTNEPVVQQQSPVSATVDTADRQDVPAVATRPQVDVTIPLQPTETTVPTEPKSNKRVSPVSGEQIAEYAVDCLHYNQTTRDWRTHDGVDIAAAAGTAVMAAADGEVYSVYEDETMGTTVVLTHDGGYTTRYASLAQEVLVDPGDLVQAGQTIGSVGRTALLECSLADHVHFSVSCNQQSIDPAEFLAGA